MRRLLFFYLMSIVLGYPLVLDALSHPSVPVSGRQKFFFCGIYQFGMIRVSYDHQRTLLTCFSGVCDENQKLTIFMQGEMSKIIFFCRHIIFSCRQIFFFSKLNLYVQIVVTRRPLPSPTLYTGNVYPCQPSTTNLFQ